MDSNSGNGHKKPPDWLLNPPLLIYGPRKGGTTLLQNLHDGSEQLFVYPSELKLKFLADMLWPTDLSATLMRYSEIATVKEVPHLKIEGYRSSVIKPELPSIVGLGDLIRNDILSVYNNLDVQPDDIKLWAVKEVGGNTDKVIKLWRQLYFQGKIVMIIREPLMVTRSVLRNRRKEGRKLSFRKVYKQVKDPYDVLNMQSRYLGDPTICFVTYDGLTSDPKKTMKYICSYLGIDYDDVLSTPTIFGEPVIVSTASRAVEGVFHERSTWYSGLGMRDIFYVLLSIAYIRFRNALRKKGNRIGFSRYREIAKDVEMACERNPV
jgi:hypothetical protein